MVPPVRERARGLPDRHDGIRRLDNRVLVTGKVRARGRGSGTPIDQLAVWLVTMRDGKGERFEAFLDREEALRAARHR